MSRSDALKTTLEYFFAALAGLTAFVFGIVFGEAMDPPSPPEVFVVRACPSAPPSAPAPAPEAAPLKGRVS